MADNNIELSKIFDEGAEQENALFTALMECGKDFAKSDKKLPHDNSFYDWLEKTPKKSMVSELISKLNELGYEIKKEETNA